MAGIWSGLFSGSVRKLECPHCRRSQTITRRPMPFEVRCKHCGQLFRVTEAGVFAVRQG
jgi:ribosomal protein S27E